METAGCCFFDLFFTLIKPEYCPDMSENEVLGLSIEEWESYAEDKALYLERAGGFVTEESKIIEDITMLLQRQIVKDFLIKFTKIYKKGARSTVWLLTPRLIDYIFPFSRSLQRYA